MTTRDPSVRLGSMKGIGIREASRKYHVPPSTITDWRKRGLMRIVQESHTRGQAVLIFEPDIAALARDYKPGRGRWGKPALESIASSMASPTA